MSPALVSLVLALVTPPVAPGAASRAVIVRAVRASVAPRIDGDLSDAVWAKAPIFDRFFQRWPNAGKASSRRTSVQFAYDDRTLYVAMFAQDDPSRICRRVALRDSQIECDWLDIEIDSSGSAERAFAFGVYPSNVQLDYLRTGDNATDFDFNAVWRSATRITVDGWTAELAIPLSALRFRPGPGAVTFRVEVNRYLSHEGETDQLVYQPPSSQGALLRMATLSGLVGLHPGHGLALTPFVRAQVDHRYSPGPGYDPPSGTHPAFGAGGDLEVHPTTDLTLNGTILPDFGEVEADPAVMNLSTFETYFPEKRPFFLSGSDLYALHDAFGNPTGTQLFYSRRVGRPPPSPELANGQRLVSQPLTTDIWGALKLTGQVSDHVSVAVLDAVTRDEAALVQDADGRTSAVPVSPLSNFAVARVRAKLPKGFTVGAMATSVLRHEPRATWPQGCPDTGDAPGKDGRCSPDATTGGADATWTSPAGTYVASATLLGSQRQGGPDDSLPDGTVLRSGDTGVGGRAEFAKAGGSWIFDLSYEGYSPKLDLNQAGWLQRQNLHSLYGKLAYRTLEPHGPTRSTETVLYGDIADSFDGIDITRWVDLGESIEWKNRWTSYLELDFDPPTTDNRELRDGSLYDRPAMHGLYLNTTSDPRRALSLGGYVWFGDTLHGIQSSSAVDFSWRPTTRLELTLTPSAEWVTGDPRWFETDGAFGASHTYRLGDQEARLASMTLRGTYGFSPTLALQVYVQAFADLAHYGPFYSVTVPAGRAHVRLSDLKPGAAPATSPDFKDTSLNVNVVLRWEYRPGSVLYLVYSRAQQNGDPTPGLTPTAFDLPSLGRGPYDDVLLLKLAYYYGA